MATSFTFPLPNPFPPFSSPSLVRRFTSSPFLPHTSLLPSPLPLNAHSSTVSSSSSSISLEIFGRRGRRMYHVVKSLSAAEPKSISDDRMLVFVPPHPLIKHWVSVLRNEETPCPIFRNAMAELGRLLIYEASRDWLPTITGEIQSPMGVALVEFIGPREPVAVVPILRARLALVEHASSILPSMLTYHLGVSRDEEPTVYLNKLPDTFPEGSRVLVVNPMLATDGTIVAALNLLKERGVNSKKIKVISAVAAPPALQKLSENFPGYLYRLHVYTGIIDRLSMKKGSSFPDWVMQEIAALRLVEASPVAKLAPPVAMAFTVGIRFSNNIYGGMQFVDWARLTGVQ